MQIPKGCPGQPKNDLAQRFNTLSALGFNLGENVSPRIMRDLTVQQLSFDRLRDAYPLVRSAAHVCLERWLEFGSDLFQAGGGAIAVLGADHCIHGIAAFRPRTHLRHARGLDVEVMVAFDLRGNDRVKRMLYEELERIGRECGCRTIYFTVPAKNADPCSAARAGLERLGLKLETAGFVRELTEGGKAG